MAVGVAVGVDVGPGVAVLVMPLRTIRGADQTARSPLAEPKACTIKMKLTFCPARDERSTSRRYTNPSIRSLAVFSVYTGPVPT